MDEQKKYEVIKSLADHPDGNKDRAALTLGCTVVVKLFCNICGQKIRLLSVRIPAVQDLGTASCTPCFKWCPVPVVEMRAHMVVGSIGEFLYGLV